jgi:hypothetical protein
MTALFTLEIRQTAWVVIVATALMMLHFYGNVTSDALDGVPTLSPNTFWFFSLMMLALTVSYRQANREGHGDLWAFAMHRPASGAQIFGAKLLSGMGVFVLAIVLATISTMLLVESRAAQVVPTHPAFWLAPIVDGLTLLTFYAAGLYAGISRERSGARWIGLVLAMTGWIAVQAIGSFALAVATTLLFTAVVTAGAWARFTKPDFNAQPLWGRAANVACGLVAVGIMVMIASAIHRWATRDTETSSSRGTLPAWQYATITRDGRLELLPRASYSGLTERDVISSSQIAIDRRTVDRVIRRSYRDARAWVTPLFTAIGEGPKWYYERRLGLISIRDRKTNALIGWLGPDGYTQGARMPDARFTGSVQTPLQNSRHVGLLVLSGSVYVIDERFTPALIFTAPIGETITGASQGFLSSGAAPRSDLPWGWFNVVTTKAHTYVTDRAGKIQITVANPPADSNRVVNVYRAPYGAGAPTFVWFRPQSVSRTDSLNEVLEFRVGQGQVAERRFATSTNVIPIDVDGGAPRTVALSGSVPLVPALQVYALRRETSPVARRDAAPTVLISVLICLAMAAFIFRVCRRAGFASGATLVWTALTALVGPITLVVMWFFVEWPPRLRVTRPLLARATR